MYSKKNLYTNKITHRARATIYGVYRTRRRRMKTVNRKRCVIENEKEVLPSGNIKETRMKYTHTDIYAHIPRSIWSMYSNLFSWNWIALCVLYTIRVFTLYTHIEIVHTKGSQHTHIVCIDETHNTTHSQSNNSVHRRFSLL